jgi:peptidoglycan/xylan/chitin deacetylase (PgdA/CDA1 family)
MYSSLTIKRFRIGEPTKAKVAIWRILLALLIAIMAVPWLYGHISHAVVQNPTATAKISFTFDDGLTSALTQAQPTLAKYGLTGTSYVITKCVGMTTAPNTCHANTDASYMTWAQIKQLQATGWEIGAHTQTHPYLATSDATDGQPNVLTPSQVTQELAGSKADLTAQGIAATAFATPYGDYNNATLSEIAKYYTSHRGFADQANNIWPYNDYLLNDMPVQTGVSVAQVKAKIDAAITNHYWLILTMHDIMVTPSTNPDDYQYSVSNLDQIAAYVKTKQNAGLIAPTNISNGLVTSDTNLLPNSSFDAGIASGWSTDAPTIITSDAANNGSMPSPAKSIRLASTTKNSHLFSPHVSVDPNATYMLKSFVKVNAISSGALGFYIDEYDNNGNWISGQYKNGESTAFTEEYNFSYKPTSSSVKSASLQIISTANSKLTAFVDNTQWFALTTSAPPAQTNLVTNGTFDAGITGGWTTDDPVDIVQDTGSHGSPNNIVNSVSLKSTTKNAHLFSPHITVSSTHSYSLTSYVNLLQLTGGEIGFYVDEYDSNGNWISGKYITGIRGVSSGDVSFQYTPSTASVKTASLQVIVTGNSGINAYYDDVRWYQN